MTPDKYKFAGELFHRVRDLPKNDRDSALDIACNGDGELRDEVVALVEADQQAGDEFLGRPALEQAADLMAAPETPKLFVPEILAGRYRMRERIGAGGMGVVYEAEDLRLPRRVAVKVLPIPAFAQSKQRIQRFQREARATSQLNHPHIVSILDADCDQGCYYIAMEFVEGRTLRALIAAESRFIDSKTVLEMIGQAASALSAAHEAGIVHRDIKPENIMVRRDGFVKVLDFGLATMREPPGSAESGLRTRPGHLPGTIQYLSPEQVLGKPASPRSDLFSLGVVAYELATGVRPFDGSTDGAVYDGILHCEPALPSTIRPSLGAELDGLIMGLLEKDPELRFQSASDLRSACRRLGRTSTPASAVSVPPVATRRASTSRAARPGIAAPPARNWRLRLGIGMALLAIGLAAALLWLMRPRALPRVTGIVQVTSGGRPVQHFVSDGTRVYYAAGQQDTGIQMFQASARGGEPVPMPRLDGMFPLDISPDRSEILLGQYRKDTSKGPFPIWIASVLGSAPRRVGDLMADQARWSPNGDQIAYGNGKELRTARRDGSASRSLATVDGIVKWPAWSPDGSSIRFTLMAKNATTLWQVAANGAHLQPLFPRWTDPMEGGVWTADGHYFLFSVQRTTLDLWAVRGRRRFFETGTPATVRLTTGPMMAFSPEPSPDGHGVLFLGRSDRGELVRYDGKRDQWLPYLDGLAAMQLDYSRDGKWIAYVSCPEGSVWRSNSDGSQRMQLTAPPLYARNPRWSPDGTQIAFYGGVPGKPDRLFVVPAQGGASRQLTHGDSGPSGDADGSWSPDGASLVFGAQSADQRDNRGLSLDIIDVKTGRIMPLPDSQGLWSPRWSPDGRYVAALGPKFNLWLYNMETHARAELTRTSAGFPSWSRDSQYVYFEDNGTAAWYRVHIGDGRIDRVASLKGIRMAAGTLGWAGLTPDGSLISTRDAGSTEIYALDWDTP